MFFFRASAKKVAEINQITGWVSNTSEGDVEIVATGNDIQLKLFIEWCKAGPQKAIVTDVLVSEMEEVQFLHFDIVG